MNCCTCPIPREKSYDPGSCRNCGKRLDPSWVSNDANFNAFFRQLLALPGVERSFIAHCRSREVAGRDTFGYAFTNRNNAAEGLEEAADLAIYCYLSLLHARREGRREHVELALEAAQRAGEAHELLLRLRDAEG